MMKDKKKIAQPFRNPSEYSCYLEGVKAAAEALGYKVDSLVWGGGIPNDLTLYVPEDKPEPVVVKEVGFVQNPDGELIRVVEDDNGEPAIGEANILGQMEEGSQLDAKN